jgi:hypothetical protein
MVCGVAQAARPRAFLPPETTPDVPFCTAATMAGAVVLARRSAPERVWSAASRHRPPSAVLHALQLGQVASVLAPVAAPGTTRVVHPRGYTDGGNRIDS